MISKKDFQELLATQVSEVPPPVGWSWFCVGRDVELRSPESWFTVGVRGDTSTGGLNLWPWTGVTFHQVYWEKSNFNKAHHAVASLDDYWTDKHADQLVKALKHVTSHTERDLLEQVLGFSHARNWQELQAYVQLSLGDVRAPIQLLEGKISAWESAEVEDKSGQVPRCEAVLAAVREGGAEGGLALLRQWRHELHSSVAWRRFRPVQGGK